MCIIQLLISVNGGVFWTMQIRLPYRYTWAMLQVLSGVRVSYFLFCYFVCITLVNFCSWLYLSIFHVWSLSLDYIPLISVRILDPLLLLIKIKRMYVQICSFGKTSLHPYLPLEQYQSVSTLAIYK